MSEGFRFILPTPKATDGTPIGEGSVRDRICRLFQYGSYRKTVFVSPDMLEDVLAFTRKGINGWPVDVVVPDHWRYGMRNAIVAWDHESERPDVA